MVRACSAILDPVNKGHWEQIQHSDGGCADLLHHFEEYTNTLVQNMRKTYLKPFTIVTDNMSEFLQQIPPLGILGCHTLFLTVIFVQLLLYIG